MVAGKTPTEPKQSALNGNVSHGASLLKSAVFALSAKTVDERSVLALELKTERAELLPLAVPRKSASRKSRSPIWSRRPGLNGRPAVYETAALPTELRRHLGETVGRRDEVLFGMITANSKPVNEANRHRLVR